MVGSFATELTNITVNATVNCANADILYLRYDFRDRSVNHVCANAGDPIDFALLPSFGLKNYQRADKHFAFLYSAALGWMGADWFSLARGNGLYITIGIFKLLWPIVALFGIAAASAVWLRVDIREKRIADNIVIAAKLCVGFWWLIDWCRVLTDSFPDGNGESLAPW